MAAIYKCPKHVFSDDRGLNSAHFEKLSHRTLKLNVKNIFDLFGTFNSIDFLSEIAYEWQMVLAESGKQKRIPNENVLHAPDTKSKFNSPTLLNLQS